MQNTIIKGNGNSRSIRFPPNAISIWPSWEAFLADAISTAGAPCDLGPLNAAGVQQMGTALNKENLLTDATEVSLWGGAANRTLNQALQQLRSLITTAQNTANGRLRIETGSYVGTNTTGSTGPNRLSFSFPPKLIIIFEGLSIGSAGVTVPIRDPRVGIFMAGANSAGRIYFNSGAIVPVAEITNVTWDGNTVEWYLTENNRVGVGDQLNSSNRSYKYIAIG